MCIGGLFNIYAPASFCPFTPMISYAIHVCAPAIRETGHVAVHVNSHEQIVLFVPRCSALDMTSLHNTLGVFPNRFTIGEAWKLQQRTKMLEQTNRMSFLVYRIWVSQWQNYFHGEMANTLLWVKALHQTLENPVTGAPSGSFFSFCFHCPSRLEIGALGDSNFFPIGFEDNQQVRNAHNPTIHISTPK